MTYNIDNKSYIFSLWHQIWTYFNLISTLGYKLSFSMVNFSLTSLFLLISAIFCWCQQKFKNLISLEPFVREKCLTPRWKALLKLHLENGVWWTRHDYFLLALALFVQNIWNWRHVTSRDVIMLDFHKNPRKCSSS